MKKSIRIFLVTFLFSVFTVPLNADVVMSQFDDLIRDSDLIIRAWVFRVNDPDLNEDGTVQPRSVKVKPQCIIKGKTSEAMISLRFGFDLQEQDIREYGQRLLFLKKDENGEYYGTQHGRSYWPIKHVPDWIPATPYVFPMDNLVIEEGLVMDEQVLAPGFLDEKIQVLYFLDVVDYVRQVTQEQNQKDVPG